MQIKVGLEKEYAAYVKLNSNDDYSRAIVDYLQAWASSMEKAIAKGERVKDIAEKTRNAADTMEMSGFGHGLAVSALVKFWQYGEDLLKWHNSYWGIGKVKKGVVNPAILSLRVK